MTRPMPGPPKDWWYCTPFAPYPGRGEPGMCTSDMPPEEYMPLTALNKKRLTDAECADEWEVAEQGASLALLYFALGDKRVTAWQAERFKNAAETWRRFATHPHALEARP